jgi:hypothetical protein
VSAPAEHQALADDFVLRKYASTQVARLARAGYAAYELAAGGWLVCKWDWSSGPLDAASLKALADRIEGVR